MQAILKITLAFSKTLHISQIYCILLYLHVVDTATHAVTQIMQQRKLENSMMKHY